LTKADIARAVYERHGGLSSREAARLVDTFFSLLRERLLKGEKVQITGFGTFLVKTRRERRGRNPKTGDIIAIRSRKSIFFRSSPQVEAAAASPEASV
jgi:integration host factor subunit alpha